MSSFVAPNSPAPAVEPDDTIQNHPFFPDLSVLAFRSAMRVDNVTSEPRCRQALMQGMLDTNLRLATWLFLQQEAGCLALDDVPERPALPIGANNELYLRAIYSLAMANLLEKYRDYDTTGAGETRADNHAETVQDHRRNAAWAICDLTARPRTTVDLI